MECGVVVHGAVARPDKATHARASLRRELTVEDDEDAFVRAGGDQGGLEEELLHLILLVQIQCSLWGETKPMQI